MLTTINEKIILEKFLNFDLDSADQVLQEFATLENAQFFAEINGYDNFVYVPVSKKDRVLLVAHADTVLDNFQGHHEVILDGDIYCSMEYQVGIGADDRAGCAILYLLKDSVHSLLITNGEDIGRIAANSIKNFHKEIFEEFNAHRYVIEFDRRNANDYKFYNISVSFEFRKFIEDNTGYKDVEIFSSTDITVLYEKICGVNLSVGYYYEHFTIESLNFNEWLNTLNIARKMLAPK